jgi:serine/threonine protein phosphatase PrpC
MKVNVGAATDIGQVREGNEDSFLVVAPLFAVADGMGGHRGGEVACVSYTHHTLPTTPYG